MSPISDMLGLVLESAAGERLSDLISHSIWRPMGAESDAYITVDAKGAPRAAGGICVRPRDLARFGQVMCNGGLFNGNQVIPADWIRDTTTHGSYEAWQQGSFSHLLPKGRYRNQWYQTGNPNGAFCAIGIHGQWIYADPANEVVIVKQSSQPDPVDETLDMMLLDLYGRISDLLGG
jgi:CubicO group peptidase (beta-lactamase class C family)